MILKRTEWIPDHRYFALQRLKLSSPEDYVVFSTLSRGLNIGELLVFDCVVSGYFVVPATTGVVAVDFQSVLTC